MSTTIQDDDVLLRARDLHAGYNGAAVTRGFNLEIARGQIVALIGPNGAGKSTTIATLIGEIPAVSGEIEWFGSSAKTSVSSLARAGVGYVPEQRSIFMSLSVRDNLLLGAGGVDAALGIFPELEKDLKRPAGLLSGGQQQMLALSRVLAGKPSVLLLDELSLGLAPVIVDRLLVAVQQAADSGVAVLLVEQQTRRAVTFADRWLLLRSGSIVAEGDQSVPIGEITRLYFGGSETKEGNS